MGLFALWLGAAKLFMFRCTWLFALPSKCQVLESPCALRCHPCLVPCLVAWFCLASARVLKSPYARWSCHRGLHVRVEVALRVRAMKFLLVLPSWLARACFSRPTRACNEVPGLLVLPSWLARACFSRPTRACNDVRRALVLPSWLARACFSRPTRACNEVRRALVLPSWLARAC